MTYPLAVKGAGQSTCTTPDLQFTDPTCTSTVPPLSTAYHAALSAGFSLQVLSDGKPTGQASMMTTPTVDDKGAGVIGCATGGTNLMARSQSQGVPVVLVEGLPAYAVGG